MRSTLTGQDANRLVVQGLQQPHSVALDITQGKVYWTDTAAGKVQRASYDGSVIEDVAVDVVSPTGLAVVSSAPFASVFWASSPGKIQRATVPNGAIGAAPAVRDVVLFENVAAGEDAFSVAVDGGAQQVYWTRGSPGKIQSAAFDGGGVNDVLASDLVSPRGVVVDAVAGKMYWTDGGGDGKIQRAGIGDRRRREDPARRIAGDGVEDLFVSALSPSGLALDTRAAQLYWGDPYAGVVWRSSIDGECLVNKLVGNIIPGPRSGDISAHTPPLILLGAVAGCAFLCCTCCSIGVCGAQRRKPGAANAAAAPENSVVGNHATPSRPTELKAAVALAVQEAEADVAERAPTPLTSPERLRAIGNASTPVAPEAELEEEPHIQLQERNGKCCFFCM